MITKRHYSYAIASRLWAGAPDKSQWHSIILVVLGTALLAISAHIQVPFWPVKMSMQSFVVLSLGVIYGSRLGTLTVLAYLFEGAIGLPVFQNGGGLAHFIGPTVGYLLGFVGAVWMVGIFAERRAMRSLPTAFCVLLIGDSIIMLVGMAWLANLIGFEKALSVGFLNFLPAEALKKDPDCEPW
ncbi:biotin transporter BioY [Microvirga sp. 2YAF29]|uniref:biotin transporter BioY n=1 Tax=Microvirga sp. 2YAF29 TaxID=3233031 RepID=UPI003F9C966E